MAKEVRREVGGLAGDNGKLIYIDLIVQKSKHTNQNKYTHTHIYIGIDFCNFMVPRVLGYVLFGNMVFKIHESNSFGISFFLFSLVKIVSNLVNHLVLLSLSGRSWCPR